MRLLLHFARFGPYHHARLRALADQLGPEGWEVIGLETASRDVTYGWDEVRGDGIASAPPAVPVRTIFPGRVYEEISLFEHRRGLVPVLESLAPHAVAVAGWGTPDARETLRWCRKAGVKAIVMSETREVDGRRVWWKERVKGLIMRSAHGAIVGGRSHRDYLVKLGIPAERIRSGYNVVDNAYFAREAAHWRGERSHERERVDGGGEVVGDGREAGAPMFLASNRFVPRKNLERLVEAYALYCEAVATERTALPDDPSDRDSAPPTAHRPWSLCLLGDGPLRARLIAQSHERGLNVIESAPWEKREDSLPIGATPEHPPTALRPPLPAIHSLTLVATPTADRHPGTVFFPGFRQIGELPRFYAAASAFIHPALEEPWGLVINEAMASGLPVLSGNNVGAAEELVETGRNGWTFDAWDASDIAAAMSRLAGLDEGARREMELASHRILEAKAPTDAFGRGMLEILKL